MHRSAAGTAFGAHDDPVNASEVERAEVFEQGLDGEKPDGCWRTPTLRSNLRGPVTSTGTSPRLASTVIHASCGSVMCLSPETTAASMRSRRVAGMPLVSNTVRGTPVKCRSKFVAMRHRVFGTREKLPGFARQK